MLAHLVLYANLDCFGRVDGFLLAGRKGTVSYKRDVANLQFDKGCSAVCFVSFACLVLVFIFEVSQARVFFLFFF